MQISAKDRLVRDLLADYNADVEPDETELSLGIIALTASYDKSSKELILAVWEFHVSNNCSRLSAECFKYRARNRKRIVRSN